jgi:hypothetical protein
LDEASECPWDAETEHACFKPAALRMALNKSLTVLSPYWNMTNKKPWPSRFVIEPAKGTYAATINRAAMMLLAMSFKPALKSSLIKEVTAAVEARGGRVDDHCFMKFDLRAVFEAIVERAMAILSAALRERLPGIADEIDEAFAARLHHLLGSMTQLFPTV